MKRFLKTFVTSVLKRLGDAKLVVREHAIRVIHKLMHFVKPTDVLGNLLQFKDSRNPRLREEIVNRVTGAVLTFPSYNFEFLPLCEAVAPLLADTKRRVRLAALECFAALAQAMGPTRLVPLVTAVDVVEINSDAEGLLSAVQARLARRILPRCTEDGAVSYAIMLPSSAGCQNRNVSPWGSDIEWIMAASGSSSSTPPSRSKDVLSIDLDQNGESVSKLVEINQTKNVNVNIFRRSSNWLNNSHHNGISTDVDSQKDEGISKEQKVKLQVKAKQKLIMNLTIIFCIFLGFCLHCIGFSVAYNADFIRKEMELSHRLFVKVETDEDSDNNNEDKEPNDVLEENFSDHESFSEQDAELEKDRYSGIEEVNNL
ncbi:TOG array regulator of axonemal microtubules protein 1 [Caerostris extrusa]|uniref:TOG array regulator of axonemal microtubules protein 1 n=1 Tax=Caerostris extrusa TaxID=172846 RepID=A0AAV4QNS0_CAEEX|nr:TOG array regulator of axonemal microtubules protein 1 [Caerostris extrusa]